MSTPVSRKQFSSVTGSSEVGDLDAVLLLGLASPAVAHGVSLNGSNCVLSIPVKLSSRRSGEKGGAELVSALEEAVEEIRRGLGKLQLIGAANLNVRHVHSARDAVRIEPAPESREAEALREPLDVGMADFEVHVTSPDVASDPELPRPPAKVHFEHFTEGIVGPEKSNRIGESLDFDLNVLWVAGWYRRGPDERQVLIDGMASDQEFQRKFGGEAGARKWLAAMAGALDGVTESVGVSGSQAMSLTELTQLFESWNATRDTLRDQGGNALLDVLDIASEPDLVDHIMDLLMGLRKDDNGTVFTDRKAVHAEWTILNLLRLWSVLGRDDARGLAAFEPLISYDSLEKYIRHHP